MWVWCGGSRELARVCRQSAADEESFALSGDGVDLLVELAGLVLEDGDADDVAGSAHSSTERLLRLHEHVGHVLLLAQDGQVQHDFEGVGVGSDDDQLGDASVEGLGGLVGALLDLLEGGALGNEVVQFGGELFRGEGLGAFGDILSQAAVTIVVVECRL